MNVAKATVRAAQRAFARKAAANEPVDKLQREIDAQPDELHAKEQELACFKEEVAADAVLAIIDGPESVKANPERDARIRQLQKEVIHDAATKSERQKRIGPMRAIALAAEREAAVPYHRLAGEVHSSGLDLLAQSFAVLAEAGAQLIAGDQIRIGLFGTSNFPVPEGVPVPISGLVLITNVVNGIPNKIRPASLDIPVLAAAARAISQPILNTIKEGASNE